VSAASLSHNQATRLTSSTASRELWHAASKNKKKGEKPFDFYFHNSERNQYLCNALREETLTGGDAENL